MAPTSLAQCSSSRETTSLSNMSESECRGWIEAVTGEKLSGALQEALKDGKTLCK